MKLIVSKIVFILVMFLSFQGVFSQATPPPPPTPPPGDVPVDSNLWVLMIVAVAFGFCSIKYIYNKKSSI